MSVSQIVILHFSAHLDSHWFLRGGGGNIFFLFIPPPHRHMHGLLVVGICMVYCLTGHCGFLSLQNRKFDIALNRDEYCCFTYSYVDSNAGV